MTFTTGAKLGPYEIVQAIGAGGFGQVYKARDARLNRFVAVKILPEHLSQNPEVKARFEREAQTLASLSHPHICPVFDVGQQDGVDYIVMEYLEGVTLAERLKKGALPLEEALKIAIETADALDKAHRQGVIHRDVKPSNVILTKNGAKLLDFGLAKLKTLDQSTTLSTMPTQADLTGEGAILGTIQYMSPEQLEGDEADARSDIFAFGAVLYEMVTGRRAFEGRSQSSLIAAIMHIDPPSASALQPATPRVMDRIIRRCLAKSADDRWQSAADLGVQLQWMVESASEGAAATPAIARKPRRERLAWIVATAAVIAFGYLAVLHFGRQPAEAPELRLEISTPSTPQPLQFALSPDGRYIVFVASGDGAQRLWLRQLDKTEARPMPGTDGANFPFWSADSRSIAYSSQGKLRRVDIAGGPPQTLANTNVLRSGAWNADGVILFSGANHALSRVSASGGSEPVAVTRLDPPRQTQHRHPQFLPDGRHFLYHVIGNAPEAAGIYVASLDGGEPKRLAQADGAAVYLPPGMIAFVRGTSLMVQHLDLKKLELTGDPMKVADQLAVDAVNWGGISVADGRLAYRAGGVGLRQLKWFDRTGKPLGVVSDPDPGNLLYPELSRDSALVALLRTVEGNADVWLLDTVRGSKVRFTYDPSNDNAPVWSPDRQRIVFSSIRQGPYKLFIGPSSRPNAETLLRDSPNNNYAQDWSRDGRFILYGEADPKTGRDLWALPMDGDPKPIEIIKTPFDERNGQFSPDGKWVAYETDESGPFQIFVQPFPVASSKTQVSISGGSQPRWRADGKELYFIGPDGKLMAAQVNVAGGIITALTPVELFPASAVAGAGTNKQQYAVSSDGRFLVNQSAESAATPITVILNWHPDH